MSDVLLFGILPYLAMGIFLIMTILTQLEFYKLLKLKFF